MFVKARGEGTKKKKDGEWEMTEKKKKKGPFGTNNRNIC